MIVGSGRDRNPRSCRSCRHFDNSAAGIEAGFPGMTAMGSGYASVRAADGLCAIHDRYVAAGSVCGAHVHDGKPGIRLWHGMSHR